jgi:ribA/ribD-fused uncharacterized protein
MNIEDCCVHSKTEISGFCKQYRFLSNFYRCPVWYEGMLYPSVENAYQALKFLDDEKRKTFCGISPSEAKKLGKSTTLPKNWDLIKVDLMKVLVFNKFSDGDLKKQLLDTDDRELKELNTWHDVFWGVDYKTDKGENKLGKILMVVRSFWKT